MVVLRLLGGTQAWPGGIEALRATGRPLVVLGGETAPDAQLMAASTVPAGVVAEALAYLSQGGPANLRELHRFLSDTLLLTGEGFEQPAAMPAFGVRPGRARAGGRPLVGVVYYRAHELSGNTGFVDTLCDALEAAGADALPVFCGSLRGAETGLYELLAGVDALVVTVLAPAGGGSRRAAGDESWDVGALAALDVPVLQGLCLTTPRAAWAESDAGLSPLDAAMQVAVPEFDGRLITVPFSFKEDGPDGVPVYVADPERSQRIAGLATAYARLRSVPNADKRLALVLSSYPTKHSRVGNAVGLDTPASAVALLQALDAAGYDLGPDVPTDGDALIHALIAAGGHDVEWLTEEQLRAAPARVPLATYQRWFAQLPQELRERVTEAWGPPPGSLYVDGAEIVLASLRLGNVVLTIQPPRGFGENPIAIYHDPALAPSHHYLAAYWWLAHEFGAHAVVHLGKHGTLEWLPGKGLGLSASCAPDAVLGDLPLIYPFIVNDPGEGTQAKRRAHATIVDHLVPPMARADSYGDLAKLEQLMDEHATVAALDPPKLPAVRAQIWTLIQAAQLHHDLHIEDRPGDDAFDDFLLHVDGYLCEIKDAQIRDGLHILGQAPEGEARTNLVLAILRARQVWGGASGAVPGLREALGLLEGKGAATAEVDRFEAEARALVEAMEARRLGAVGRRRHQPGAGRRARAAVRGDGGRAAAGPHHRRDGGRAARARRRLRRRRAVRLPHPRPGQRAADRAQLLLRRPQGHPVAARLGDRHRRSRPRSSTATAPTPAAIPRTVGLTVWGTSAMRTQGDDIAEVLALLGVRPVWDDASRRVTGFEVMTVEELGRPRVDVTVRISGFFRDAFPHVIALLDDAIRAVAALDEPAEINPLRAHVHADLADPAQPRRRSERRPPAASSAPSRARTAPGLLPLIDARNWRSDADLAEVYAVWGGYAYGRGLDGREARAEMQTAFARIEVAAKNQDNREHDIVDSDDYFQYHGGMVTMVRHLTGSLAGRVCRRLARARCGAHPHARRGDPSRLPLARRQSALDRGDAAPRLQGRLRDGRDRRLPVRLRRDGRRGRRLDV